ncbi:class I SAM-dependent methyltransferase [Brevibacillus reuszeri]|uniref:class I SAM-dependent methyltransferase n=1 Tax=Brevibacillus reuszeri TaxID=54915 RepID=UPI002898766B|nr:class I SAM-dependent methyltransferase [Brevibacillus reuszeri]
MSEQEKQLEESWVTNAEAWTQSVRQNQIESRKLATDQAIIDEIVSLHPRKVMDVGSGEGWLARALHTRGIEIIGIEGSTELVQRAQSAGGGSFYQLSYADFSKNPTQFGTDFDAAVCNFSLLSEEITELLQALSTSLAPNGVIVIHTLHPFNLAADDRYEIGWREESFVGMGEGYKAAMPWYYRTMSAWLSELPKAGLELVRCQEPVHPRTGRPLSLLLTAKPRIDR